MIERQIHLSSGGGAALQGYDGLLRFGYTRNRGIYALRVEADGAWQGMTLRAFWHLPSGNPAPSTLVGNFSTRLEMLSSVTTAAPWRVMRLSLIHICRSHPHSRTGSYRRKRRCSRCRPP